MPTTAIVATAGTPVTELADTVILLPEVDEESVVQTRFATTALALLRASLGEDLAGAVADARAVLAEDEAQCLAGLVDAEQLTFLGRGWTVGLAEEAALKLRESAQLWTESYPAMEYRHGPISIAAPGRATWAFGEVPEGLADQVRATGARFEHRDIDPMADLVRVHRLCLAKARQADVDPDNPRHLSRSIVLTRRRRARVALPRHAGGRGRRRRRRHPHQGGPGRPVVRRGRGPRPCRRRRTSAPTSAPPSRPRWIGLLATADRDGAPSRLVGCGVVVPGLVDERRGVGLWSANLGWRDLPIRDAVAARLRVCTAVGHDVRAGLLAETRLGAARGARHALFLPVGTGIAGALLLEGVLVSGDGWAGELGHMRHRPGRAALRLRGGGLPGDDRVRGRGRAGPRGADR